MLLLLSCTEYNPISTTKGMGGGDSETVGHELNPPLLVESCNGLDDDRDGLVDEGFPDENQDGRADCLDHCSVASASLGSIEGTRTCEAPVVTVEDPWDIELYQRFTFVDSPECEIGAIADFNRDGILDIVCTVVYDTTKSLFVVSGDGQGIIFTSFLPMYHSPIAIADVDGDGWLELFAVNRFGNIISLSHDGRENWTSSMQFLWTGDTRWANPVTQTNLLISYSSVTASPVLASYNGWIDALTGATLLDKGQPNIWPEYIRIINISDLNKDGSPEIYDLKSQLDWSGNILWDQSLPGEVFSRSWNIPIQADTDSEGEMLVFNYPGFYMFDTNGSVLSHMPITAPPDFYEPCAGDIDGDGIMEYIQPALGGIVKARHPDGSLMWETEIFSSTEAGIGGCSVFDFDMDGRMEAVINYDTTLLIMDGSGNILWQTQSHPYMQITPIVIDIDGDGSVEIVTVDYGTDSNGGHTISYINLYRNVHQSWPPGKRIWSGNAWTGVELFEDGSVPRQPAPSWTTTKLWRGEPAWSEEGVDLAPELVDACEVSCTEGEVRLSVRLQNLGPQDAPVGTPLAVYRLDGSGNRTLDQVLYLNAPLNAQMGSQSWELIFERSEVEGGVDLVAGDDGSGLVVYRDCDFHNNALHYDLQCEE